MNTDLTASDIRAVIAEMARTSRAPTKSIEKILDYIRRLEMRTSR